MENGNYGRQLGHAGLRCGRISLPGQVYHLTVTTQDRTPCFRDFHAGCIASACFEDESLRGDAALLAWVLMPDHAHWLLRLGAQASLSRVVGNMKSASARKVNLAMGWRGPLWSRAYHDHALRQEEDILTIANYIVANPVRAGLVEHVGDYPFWNTLWP